MEKHQRKDDDDDAAGTASPPQMGEVYAQQGRGGHGGAAPHENNKLTEAASAFLDRLKHFTWANYTLPMSTGGLALLLSERTQPHTFRGLHTIGKVVYIFDLLLFILVTAAVTYRFVRWPGTLRASVVHPTEGLFMATSVLSVASIVTGIAHYGVDETGGWLLVVYHVLFWVYFAVSYGLAVGQYVLLFTSSHLKIQDMTPAWDLPIFPFMLCGTIASAGAGLMDADDAVPMMVAGLMAQGLGMMVSLAMYASYIHRMIQYGFPSPNSRPGMFIAVGPPSFTSLAIIGLANDYAAVHLPGAGSGAANDPIYFGASADSVAVVLRVVSLITSLFIWSLSLWFFCIAVVACLAVRRKIGFHLNWWSFVFPNVGFTIAVLTIGKTLDSSAVKWFGTAMTLCIVCTWIFVFVSQVRAVVRRDIWSEGKDEDVYVDERKHAHGKDV